MHSWFELVNDENFRQNLIKIKLGSNQLRQIVELNRANVVVFHVIRTASVWTWNNLFKNGNRRQLLKDPLSLQEFSRRIKVSGKYLLNIFENI